MRGHQARAFVRRLMETTDAALQLQAVTRGHMSRLQVYRLKLHREQSARALLLQRSWRATVMVAIMQWDFLGSAIPGIW